MSHLQFFIVLNLIVVPIIVLISFKVIADDAENAKIFEVAMAATFVLALLNSIAFGIHMAFIWTS